MKVTIARGKTIIYASGSEEALHWSLQAGIRENTKVFAGHFCFGGKTDSKSRRKYNERYRKENKVLLNSYATYQKRIKSDGICIFCREINWYYLEEHHPYPNELPDTTFTLCANCHTKLHFLTGGNRNVRK